MQNVAFRQQKKMADSLRQQEVALDPIVIKKNDLTQYEKDVMMFAAASTAHATNQKENKFPLFLT